MSIGKNIRRLRKERGMTQLELGIALGFNVRADVRISQYENGVRTPRENLIIKLANIFDVDIMELTVPEEYVWFLSTLDDFEDLCRGIISDIEQIRENNNPTKAYSKSRKGSDLSDY